MLKKVKRIKLGKQVYQRIMKRVLERDGWRCRMYIWQNMGN